MKDLLISLWPQEAVIVKEHLVSAEKRGVQVTMGIFGDYNSGGTYTVNLEACGGSSKKRLSKRLNVVVGDSKRSCYQ